MRRAYFAIACAAALFAACVQRDRVTEVTDPEVQELLAVAAKVDLQSLGFSAPPTSGLIRIYKKGPAHFQDAHDAGLITADEPASLLWFFNREGDGYRLACASETVYGTRTFQRSGGGSYRESLHINYVAKDPGVCGSKLKTGVSAIYWGPDGTKQIYGAEVVQLRAQIENARP